jgi:hypothetical protein
MTEAAVTQSDVYRLFKDVDRIPEIIEPRLGRWRAWPIAKMLLVWHLMYPDSSRPNGGGIANKIWGRLTYVLSDISIALQQAPRFVNAATGGAIAMLYLPRIHRFADGQPKDAIFGDLLCGGGLVLSTIGLEQRPWGAEHHRSEALNTSIRLDPYQSAVELLAVYLALTPAIRRAGDRIDAILARTDLPIEPILRRRKVMFALALFEARRRLFQHLLRRLDVRALVLTYGPGRAGEIAAAKEIGIPTVELQHGVVSAHCPDYAWPAEYLPFKAELPFPDRMALFGPMFCREIMRSGFWTENEVSAVGSSATAYYRQDARMHTRRAGPHRLLFMTQSTVRDAAIGFWRAFLSDAREASEIELLFKVHSEEAAHRADYQALANVAQSRVTILPLDIHPFEAMVDADVVIAYNSMSLVEALGLGKPAISLCGGSIPGGFAGTFDLPGLVTAMPHLTSPEELRMMLRLRLQDPAAYSQWQFEAREKGTDFFADGFVQTTAQLINDLISPGPNSRIEMLRHDSDLRP